MRMTSKEMAARVTLVDNFATMMSIPLNDDQVQHWVELLLDIPLAWLKIGLDRCAARFTENRRPRPGDIRRATRELAGPVFVRDGDPDEPGFAGHNSNDAWPPDARAHRLLREGRAITPLPPRPTIVDLSEVPVEIGPRGQQLERLSLDELEAAFLKEPEIKKIRG